MSAGAALAIESGTGRLSDRRDAVMPSSLTGGSVSSGGVCRLLREDSELADAIPWPRRGQALSECTSRTARIAVGYWGAAGPGMRGGIGLLVLDGLDHMD